jgi:hypothetical protein
MKVNYRKKALTLGNLIETVYGVCGNRRAKGIIRLAIDAHVVVFRLSPSVCTVFKYSRRSALAAAMLPWDAHRC